MTRQLVDLPHGSHFRKDGLDQHHRRYGDLMRLPRPRHRHRCGGGLIIYGTVAAEADVEAKRPTPDGIV